MVAFNERFFSYMFLCFIENRVKAISLIFCTSRVCYVSLYIPVYSCILLYIPVYSCIFLYIPVYSCIFSFISTCSPEKCKVMDSKMRPLWLTFNNMDPLGGNVLQIFKNGDGKGLCNVA